MRRIALVLAGLLLFAAAPLAVSGMWTAQALQDHDGYADRMHQVWLHGGVRSEFGAVVTDRTQQQLQASLGQGGLASIATGLATSLIESGLSSDRFASAWGQWHRQLHADLAAVVVGDTPRTVVIDGSLMTVDMAPLVSSLLTGPLGGLAIRAVGEDELVQQIDTGYDLQGQLEAFGQLWRSRWWAVFAAVAAAGLWAWLWPAHLRGAGIGLLIAAGGCWSAGLWRSTADPAPDGDFPAMTTAITDALLGGWSTWLLLAAAVLGGTGAVVVLATRGSPTRTTAGRT